MKKLIALALIGAVLLGFTACKETDSLVNDKNNEALRAWLKESYPSLNAAQIRIQVIDFQDIDILLGDKQLFKKSEEELQKIVNEIAEKCYALYSENNYLDEGTIVFTQNETAAQQKAAKPDDPQREYSFDFKDYEPKE